MGNNYFKQSLLFIFFVLLQVLVLRHISFLGYATPFLYIYFILKLPIGINRNLIVLLGFCLGFVIDIFCNTPGVNAAATTLVAFMRRPVQGLFFTREDFENLVPKWSILGNAFVKYTIGIILIHHATLISIESFSYLNVGIILLRIVASSILTLILILGVEGFSIKNKK